MLPPPAPPKRKETSVIQYAAVGLEMGVSAVIGIVGGRLLDDKFETTPVFFWIGFALGIGAATKSIVMIAKRAKKELQNNDTEAPKKN